MEYAICQYSSRFILECAYCAMCFSLSLYFPLSSSERESLDQWSVNERERWQLKIGAIDVG